MVSVNDEIADKLVSHQIGLQRLSNRTVRKILKMLRVSDRRIARRLLEGDITDVSRRRQEAILKQIRETIDEVYEDATISLRRQLSDLAEYEGEYQLNLLQKSVGSTVDFVSISADQVIAAAISEPFQGKYLKEWGKELSDAQFRRVRDAVRLGVVEGRTTPEIVRELRGTRAQGYKDGILAIDKRNAEAVVRTAVNHTATAARERVYGRNKKLIKGVQILATLDARTSKICMVADGRVAYYEGYSRSDFPEGTLFLEDVPSLTNESRTPLHINCRSTTTPILKSLRELGLKKTVGTRASMNGQVPADMSYSDWLKKQSKDVQDDVLGKGKAELFRKGEPIERFINEKGKEVTLDELRKRDG